METDGATTTGLSIVEQQFEQWEKKMPGIVLEILQKEMPGIIQSAMQAELAALQAEMKTLSTRFVSQEEFADTVARQQNVSDEKYAARDTVARLEGRLEAVEKTTAQNASAIDRMQRYVENATASIQSSVSNLVNTVDTSIRTISENIRTLADRQNNAEKRLADTEDRVDKADMHANEIVREADDLRTRMLPVRNYIFGGEGHVGMPETLRNQDVKIDAVLTMIKPISEKFVALERREEAQRQRIEMAKNIAKSALKNPGAWLAGLIGGTPLTVVVAALADNPAAKEILVLIQTLLEGK